MGETLVRRQRHNIPNVSQRNAVDQVQLVSWPSGELTRRSLALSGVPRLLLVDPAAAPPADLADDEDWVRATADSDEVEARARRVLESCRRLLDHVAFVDEHRVLHRSGATVPLTKQEAAILHVLMAAEGKTVTVDAIGEAGWVGGAAPSRDSVHAAVARLRRRTVGLGVVVHSVRGTGYAIHVLAAG